MERNTQHVRWGMYVQAILAVWAGSAAISAATYAADRVVLCEQFCTSW